MIAGHCFSEISHNYDNNCFIISILNSVLGFSILASGLFQIKLLSVQFRLRIIENNFFWLDQISSLFSNIFLGMLLKFSIPRDNSHCARLLTQSLALYTIL